MTVAKMGGQALLQLVGSPAIPSSGFGPRCGAVSRIKQQRQESRRESSSLAFQPAVRATQSPRSCNKAPGSTAGRSPGRSPSPGPGSSQSPRSFNKAPGPAVRGTAPAPPAKSPAAAKPVAIIIPALEATAVRAAKPPATATSPAPAADSEAGGFDGHPSFCTPAPGLPVSLWSQKEMIDSDSGEGEFVGHPSLRTSAPGFPVSLWSQNEMINNDSEEGGFVGHPSLCTPALGVPREETSTLPQQPQQPQQAQQLQQLQGVEGDHLTCTADPQPGLQTQQTLQFQHPNHPQTATSSFVETSAPSTRINPAHELIHEATSTSMAAMAPSTVASPPSVPDLKSALKEQQFFSPSPPAVPVSHMQSALKYAECFEREQSFASCSTSSFGHAWQTDVTGQISSNIQRKRPSSAPSMRPKQVRQQQQQPPQSEQSWRPYASVDEATLNQPSAHTLASVPECHAGGCSLRQRTLGVLGGNLGHSVRDCGSHWNEVRAARAGDVCISPYSGFSPSSCSTRPTSAQSGVTAGTSRPVSAGSVRPQSAGSMRPQSAGSSRRYSASSLMTSSVPPGGCMGKRQDNERKRVWPPPPVRIRPGPTPNKDQPSNYVLWLRQQAEEGENNLALIHNAMRERDEKDKGGEAEVDEIAEGIQQLFHTISNKEIDGPQRRSSVLGVKISLDADRRKVVDETSFELPEPEATAHRSKPAPPPPPPNRFKPPPNRFTRGKYQEARASGQWKENMDRTHLKLQIAQIARLKVAAQKAHAAVTHRDLLKMKAQHILDGGGFVSPGEIEIIRDVFRCSTGGDERKKDRKSLMRLESLCDDEARIGLRTFKELLADFGLVPKTHEEKLQVSEVMNERLDRVQNEESHDGEPNIRLYFDLVIVMVHEVRQALENVWRQVLWEHFLSLDADNDGVLDQKEALNTLIHFKLYPQDEDELNDLLHTINSADKDGNGIDFEEFRCLTQTIKEHLAQQQRMLQRQIAQEADLTRAMFDDLREDLVNLKKEFIKHDEDCSNALETREIRNILLTLGLAPRNVEERQRFKENFQRFNVDGSLDFKGFLRLVFKLRTYIYNEQNWKGSVQQLFNKADKDNSQSLEGREIGFVLTKLGLNPRNRAEQREILEIVEDADFDGSGSLDLQEFEVVAQRVWERLRALQRDQDENAALEIGFTSDRFHELRELYERLEDGAGLDGISILEARKVVHWMQLGISSDILRLLFSQVGGAAQGKGTKRLDFLQFLRLVRLFEQDTTDVATRNMPRTRYEAMMGSVPLKPQRKVGDGTSPVKKG